MKRTITLTILLSLLSMSASASDPVPVYECSEDPPYDAAAEEEGPESLVAWSTTISSNGTDVTATASATVAGVSAEIDSESNWCDELNEDRYDVGPLMGYDRPCYIYRITSLDPDPTSTDPILGMIVLDPDHCFSIPLLG